MERLRALIIAVIIIAALMPVAVADTNNTLTHDLTDYEVTYRQVDIPTSSAWGMNITYHISSMHNVRALAGADWYYNIVGFIGGFIVEFDGDGSIQYCGNSLGSWSNTSKIVILHDRDDATDVYVYSGNVTVNHKVVRDFDCALHLPPLWDGTTDTIHYMIISSWMTDVPFSASGSITLTWYNLTSSSPNTPPPTFTTTSPGSPGNTMTTSRASMPSINASKIFEKFKGLSFGSGNSGSSLAVVVIMLLLLAMLVVAIRR